MSPTASNAAPVTTPSKEPAKSDDSGSEPLSPKELLYEIAIALVDRPTEVWIEAQVSEDKKVITLIVHTHPDDRGKVIGSEGRAVRTLRDLFGRIAASQNKRIMIVVSDTDDAEAATGPQE
jgi:predicted RNA-binding protein YlqC (UPF0109 family)